MTGDDRRLSLHGLIHHCRQTRLRVTELNLAHESVLSEYDHCSHISRIAPYGKVLRSYPVRRSISDGVLAGRAVVKAHNHGGVGNDDGIATLLGWNLEPALDRGDGHRSVRQLFRDRCRINRAGVR